MKPPENRISEYNYNGPSMYPLFKPGDGIIINKDVPFEMLKKGDVICFYSENKEINITHRIITLTTKGLITRGDNNSDNDSSFVLPEDNPQYVKGIRRGDKTIKIHGGLFGMFIHKKNLFRRILSPYIRTPISRVIDLISGTGILYKLRLFDKKFSIGKFNKNGKKTAILFLGKRRIGKIDKDGIWRIKIPWRFFIDPKKITDKEEDIVKREK